MGLKASTCKFGNIYIELYQNACTYEAGKIIYGMIHVRQTEIFDAESLTMSLFGEERTLIKIDKNNGEKKKSKTWGAAE